MACCNADSKNAKHTRGERVKDHTKGSVRAIGEIISKARSDPHYEGTDSSAGGCPRSVTPEEEAQLRDFMAAEVGISRVTVPCCKKRLPFLRRLSNEGVRLVLRILRLAWRLRRGKSAVAKAHRPARLAYCRWVLRQPQSDLNQRYVTV